MYFGHDKKLLVDGKPVETVFDEIRNVELNLRASNDSMAMWAWGDQPTSVLIAFFESVPGWGQKISKIKYDDPIFGEMLVCKDFSFLGRQSRQWFSHSGKLMRLSNGEFHSYPLLKVTVYHDKGEKWLGTEKELGWHMIDVSGVYWRYQDTLLEFPNGAVCYRHQRPLHAGPMFRKEYPDGTTAERVDDVAKVTCPDGQKVVLCLLTGRVRERHVPGGDSTYYWPVETNHIRGGLTAPMKIVHRDASETHFNRNGEVAKKVQPDGTERFFHPITGVETEEEVDLTSAVEEIGLFRLQLTNRHR